MTPPSRTAVYVATTPGHLAEACVSAVSLRARMPSLHIALFSQLEGHGGIFDMIVPIVAPLGASADKIAAMKQLPHDQILFLDTDTYVCGSLDPAFTLLDRFELLIAPAAIKATYEVPPPTDAFPEYNTGVMFLRNTSSVRALLDRWLALYQSLRDRDPERVYDQPAFRQALFESSVAFHTLPSEYNCRFIFPGYLSGPARVIHGRGPEMSSVAQILNHTTGKRVHTFYSKTVRVFREQEAMPSRWVRLGRRLGFCD